jgi:hypothetical protein
VIGYGHLGRYHLKGREGDAANVVLTAIGHISASSSPGSDFYCA